MFSSSRGTFPRTISYVDAFPAFLSPNFSGRLHSMESCQLFQSPQDENRVCVGGAGMAKRWERKQTDSIGDLDN